MKWRKDKGDPTKVIRELPRTPANAHFFKSVLDDYPKDSEEEMNNKKKDEITTSKKAD